MEGKKRYVAIILFLLICLMLFTFATTGEEELETGKGNDTNIQEVTNKGDSEKDKETEKENSNESNTGSTGSSNNGNSNAGDDEDLEGTGNTDNSAWDNALKAVEELEKLLTDDQLNIARELVEEITNSDQYKELIERVEDAEDAIDATALVEALEKMVEEAAKKEDINDASDFRDEEVLDSINEIDGEYLDEVKEELLKRVEELNKILDDETAPTVEGIKDGDKTKEDVELTITDDNEVTTTVTKDGETYDYVEKFTEEGTYEVTVVDSAFNETKLTFTIDKTAIAVQSANMYTNGKKYVVDKDTYYYATNGQVITAYVRLKEQSATLPVITLTIDGKEYVLENVKESFHNASDKENGIYKYEGTFTIPADMEVENSIVTYTVTNIADEAGNETIVTKVTNKNINIVDTVKPKYDKLALVGGKGYWFDKEYKQFAKNNTIVYVNVRMYEKLATTPVVTLNDTITLTKPGTVKEVDGIWIYSYSYRLTEGDGIADGVLQVKVTNVADKAGNSIELTNEHATMESQSEIIVDRATATYKFYKEGSSLAKDEIQPTIIDGKLYFGQNVRVVFEEENSHFIQYTHNDFVNNESKTTVKRWQREALTDGEHTMKVKDAAGNVTEVTFIIDTTAPTYKFYKEGSSLDKDEIQPTIIDGKLYFNQNVRVRFVEETSHFTQYIHNDFVNNENKTTIKSWTREAKTEGEHTMKVTDAFGHVTEVTFVIDKTPNRVTQTFYRGDKIIDKTFYVKNGDKIQFNIGFSEKLGEDAVITIGGKKVELTYERYFEATKSHMYYGYLEVAEDETELVEGELEISISNITDEVGNPGFYYQTNGKKVMASYKNVLTTNGHKVVYDNTANRVTQTFFRGDVTEGKMNYVTNGSKIQFNIGFSEKLSEDMVITIGGKEVEMTYEKYVVATKSHMYYGYLEVTAEDNFEEGILEIKISNITDFVGNKGFYYQTNGKKVYQELTQDKCTNAEQVFYDVTGPEVTPSYTETTTEQDEEFTNFPTFEVKDNSNQSVTEELISGSVDTTKLGSYKLTYRFTDIVGNYTDVTVTVKVVDTTAPVITGITDGAYYNTKDTHAIPSASDKNGVTVFVKTTIKDTELISLWKNNKEIVQVGTYQVYAVDKFGNKSEEITVHIDPYAPKVLVLDRVENVSGAYLPIKPVILEHNLDTIEVTLDGKKIDFKEGDQLTKDGKYVMTVTDKANNSTTVEFTMDSVAPTMMVSPTSLGVVDSLDLNDADNITGLLLSEDADFQLMKVEKNITVLGKEIPIYKYTKLPEDGIIDEEGQYIIIAYDKAYNVTAYKFIVDRSAPTVNVEEGKYYSSVTINVEDANMASGSLEELKDLIPGLGSIISSISKLDPSITIKEENDLLKTTIENGYVVDEDGTYTLVAKDVIGVNPLFSKEEQAAHTTTVTFHIDTKKPTANVVEGGVYKKVTVSVEDAHLDEESITINGSKYDGKEITEEGTYVLEAKDLAGNTLTVNFEVDKTPITISGVEEGEFYNTNKDVEVISKDESATVKLNGAAAEKEMTVSTEGENTILVTDKWGNTEEVTFTIDKTAPTIKHNFESNNITKGVKGTETLDVKALVEDNIDSDKYIDPVITHSTKDVNEVIISKEYIGTYTLTYNAKDTAGNKAEQVVVTIEVIIDDYVVSFVDVDGKNFTYTYGDTISSFEATIYSAELDEYVTLEDGDITFDKVSSDFVNAGTYKVTATPNTTKYPGAKAVSQNITINKKAVTVTFAKSNGTETVDAYEFDGNKNPFKIVGVDGVLAGEEVTATVSYGKCDFGIGSCTATAKLDSDNYTITNPAHKFTIKQANATVTLPTTITGKVTIVNGEGQTIPNEYATIVISEKHTAKGTQNITTEDYTSPECVWNWKKLDYVCPEITNTYEVAIKYQTIQVISNEYMIVPNTEGKINGDQYIKQASQIASALGITIVEDVYEQVKAAMPTTGTSAVYITEVPSVEKVTE